MNLMINLYKDKSRWFQAPQLTIHLASLQHHALYLSAPLTSGSSTDPSPLSCGTPRCSPNQSGGHQHQKDQLEEDVPQVTASNGPDIMLYQA